MLAEAFRHLLAATLGGTVCDLPGDASCVLPKLARELRGAVPQHFRGDHPRRK